LAAVKTAFGGERLGGHPVDRRGTVPLLRWYVVVIAVRDRREKSRLDLVDSPKPSVLGRILSGAMVLLALSLLAFLLVGVTAG